MRIFKWRKMTWAILIFSGLMLIWIIAGSASSNAADKCAKDQDVLNGIMSKQACIDASKVGTGIGVVLLGMLWFVGFLVLSIIWFMTRPRQRVDVAPLA